MELTVSGETVKSDESGVAKIKLPRNQPFLAEIFSPNYHKIYYFGHTCDEGCEKIDGTDNPETLGDFASDEPLIAPDLSALVASSFGTQIDEEKGHIFVSVFKDSDKPGTIFDGAEQLAVLEGATIEIDSESELMLTQDDSPVGVSIGSEIQTGVLILLNADVGTSTIKIIPPPEYTRCNIFPYFPRRPKLT